jgi:hypothetical protein
MLHAGSRNVRNGSNSDLRLNVWNGWKADIARQERFAHFGRMTWLLRRLMGPLMVASAACTALLFVWTMPGVNTGAKLTPHDLALGYSFILPFAAVGMILLLPIALALRDLSLSGRVYPLVVTAVGAVLGIALVLPISDDARLSDFFLAGACGAVSATAWLAFNRGSGNRPS